MNPEINHRRDGRWRKGNQAASKGGLTQRLPLRHSRAQAENWAEAAAIAGLGLPDWARTSLDESARALRHRVYTAAGRPSIPATLRKAPPAG